MSFAENLQAFRKKNGLTQEDLAELLGVSRQAVSKWEQGDGYPEVEKLLVLAEKLGVSLDALMGREPSEGAAGAPSGAPLENAFSAGQASSVSSYTAAADAVSDTPPAGVVSYVPDVVGDDPLNFDENPERETPEAKHNRLLLWIALVCIAVIILLFLSGLN